jgi:hypothetical protein
MPHSASEMTHIAGGIVDAAAVRELLEFAPRFDAGDPSDQEWDHSDQFRDRRYDAPLGSGKRSKNQGRVFLKRWFRFVADFCADEVRWRHELDGYSKAPGGQKLFTDEDKFAAFNNCGKLGFMTAKTIYPDLTFEDVREVLKSRIEEGASLDDYYVDPNSKTRKPYEFEHDRKRRELGERYMAEIAAFVADGDKPRTAVERVATAHRLTFSAKMMLQAEAARKI